MPALKNHLGNIAIFIKDKKALVQKSVFSPPLKGDLKQPRIPIGIAYQKVTQDQVYCAFVAQSTKKTAGPNKINFRILHMI